MALRQFARIRTCVLVATLIAATPGSGRTRPTHDTGRIYRTRNRSITGKNFARRNAKSEPGRTSPSFSGARKDRLDLSRVSWRQRSIIVFRPVSRHLPIHADRELDQKEIHRFAPSGPS